jgi:glycosyltransferase involved in cell wall biosynthesis
MNIGIYTHNIKTGKSGGVEQYANWIVGALLDYTGHKVFIFTNKDLAEVSILKWKRFQNCTVVTLPFRSKIFRFVCYNSFSNKIGFSKLIDWLHHKNGWRWMLKMFADPRVIIYCYNLDVLHFPTQIMPYYNWKIPIAVTLHDLQHEHLPEFFSAKRLATRRYWYEKSALECSQILTTYQHTKDDIIKYIGVPSEKISVTSFGFTRPNFFVPLDSASVLKKYNIPNNFLLYPARVWKHKNHLFLLKSIKMYKEKYGDIFLVCTGGKTELSEEIYWVH